MRNLTMRERAGLAAVVVALVVLALGGWVYQQQKGAASAAPLAPITPYEASTEVPAGGPDSAPADETQPDGAATEQAPAQAPSGAAIVVHVSGAVLRPGVYTLKNGDRIYKAVRAAGGFKKNAVQDALNLADRLRDGDQINVPVRRPQPMASAPSPLRSPATSPSRTSRLAPVPSALAGTGGTSPKRGRVLGSPPRGPSAASSSATPFVAESAGAGGGEAAGSEGSGGAGKFRNPGDGTVDINTATAEELQRLPGVGPAMAARILAYREEVGGLKSAEQLMDVKGVGEKTFAKMQPFVRVD